MATLSQPGLRCCDVHGVEGGGPMWVGCVCHGGSGSFYATFVPTGCGCVFATRGLFLGYLWWCCCAVLCDMVPV